MYQLGHCGCVELPNSQPPIMSSSIVHSKCSNHSRMCVSSADCVLACFIGGYIGIEFKRTTMRYKCFAPSISSLRCKIKPRSRRVMMINDFEERSSQTSLSPPALSPSDTTDDDVELKVQFGVDLQAISLTAEQEERKREYLTLSRDISGSNSSNERDATKSDRISSTVAQQETTSTSAPLDSALVPPKGRPRTRLAQVKDMWLTDSEDYFEMIKKESEGEPRKNAIRAVSTEKNGQARGSLSRGTNSAQSQGMIPSDGEDEFDDHNDMKDDDEDEERFFIKPRRHKRPARNSIKDLKLGGMYFGRVTMITKYGAFIDIGFESPGLVHISEISYKFVDDIHRFVYVGQKVRVMIVSVDLFNRRFGCSLRQAMDPSLYNTVVWLSADWGRAFADSKGSPLPKRKYPIPIPPKPNLLRNLKIRDGIRDGLPE